MPLLEENVPLQRYNAFGIAAQARWFAHVRSVQDLAALAGEGRVRDLPRLVLGGGSNVLFVGDFPGLVVHVDIPGCAELGVEDGAWLIRVGAGEPWAPLVERLVRAGRPGLENLALIPGCAGAAPIQNIGAYGLELAERLQAVQVWDEALGAQRELDVAQCALGYRDSVFKTPAAARWVVVGLTLRLPCHWRAVTGYAELERELAARARLQAGPQDVFEAVCALRRRKLPDPAQLGNAGSFFKNPIVTRARHADLLAHFPSMVSYPLAGGRVKLGAGWLIEACGLKGVTRGRAGVYERQALVLVNRGGASGREILDLAREVQARVLEKFGVALEPEVRVVGSY